MMMRACGEKRGILPGGLVTPDSYQSARLCGWVFCSRYAVPSLLWGQHSDVVSLKFGLQDYKTCVVREFKKKWDINVSVSHL